MAQPVSLSQVLARPDVWRGATLAEGGEAGAPTGFAVLDAALPGCGWPRGALSELLLDATGQGEAALLGPALAAESRAARWLALVAPPLPPYAPGWAQAGVDLARLAVVDTEGADALWSCEQLLAAGAFGAVLAWLPQAEPRALRRLQLALEGRRTLAFVFRPLRCAGQASPAPLRLALAGDGHALSVRILKRRGVPLATPIELPIHPRRRAQAPALTRLFATEAPAGQPVAL